MGGSAERLVRTGRVALATLEAGTSGLPLLLLHGFTGAKEDFAELLPWLVAAGCRVAAPDHRGHGRSEHPQGAAAYSLQHLADDTLALATALGWDRFALLGWSMGGMVALRVALAAPERVVALVLVAASPGPPDGVDPELAALGRDVVAAGGMAALLEAQRGLEDVLGSPAQRRLQLERPGLREVADANLLACSPEMWAALSLDILEQDDLTPGLRSLELPALVVVGEQDRSFARPSRRLAAALRAPLVVVPDAGHAPHLENPRAFRAPVEEFLRLAAGRAR